MPRERVCPNSISGGLMFATHEHEAYTFLCSMRQQHNHFPATRFGEVPEVVCFLLKGTQFPEFSNLFQTSQGVTYLNNTAKSSKHHYQAAIPFLFLADGLANEILSNEGLISPLDAKNRTRWFKNNFLSKSDQSKLLELCPHFMRPIQIAKFTQNPDCMNKLIETGDKPLWEANAHDSFWGIGLSLTQIRAGQLPDKNAKNIMGKLLSEVRYFGQTKKPHPNWSDTLIIGDSQANRIMRFGPKTLCPILSWGGGKLDFIFQIAILAITPFTNNLVIVAGTNNIQGLVPNGKLNRHNRIRAKKIAELFYSKISRLQNYYHPHVKVFIVELFPRFDLECNQQLFKVPEQTNFHLHRFFSRPQWSGKVEMIKAYDLLKDRSYFSEKYSNGAKDMIHLNQKGVTRLMHQIPFVVA